MILRALLTAAALAATAAPAQAQQAVRATNGARGGAWQHRRTAAALPAERDLVKLSKAGRRALRRKRRLPVDVVVNAGGASWTLKR